MTLVPDDRRRRVYRMMLRMAPRRLRQRHGREMESWFVDALDEAASRGAGAVVRVWTRGMVDIVAASFAQLGRQLLRRGRVGIPREGRPIMIGSDIQFALRSLARQKFATSLVIGMLALGIAANVAVFSLVNGLFLRPFPFDEPDRLVYINEKAPKWNLETTGINFPDFHRWRQDQKLFESIAVFGQASLNLADSGGAERIDAARVSREFADVLRIRPILGRNFSAEEDAPKGPAVVILGHGLWRERFAGDPNVLGRTLKLNGRPATIIGVLPPAGDTYPGNARLWVPLQGDPNQEGRSYGFDGIGRLKPGVTIAQAELDLLRAHQPIFDTRDKERIVSPYVVELREIAVRDFRTATSTLTVAVGLLLLIACANVAAVMLARALARRREMGIRVSLGASRIRLIRQLLVENLVLSLIGGAFGLLLGNWAIRALIAQLEEQAPGWASFSLDARVMAFAFVASVVTVLLFGWAPALHAVRGDLRSAMSNVANAVATPQGGRRTLRLLVAGEFALATLLLVCGGLLLRAYDRVQNVDPGFSPQGVLTATLSLPAAAYEGQAQRLAFWDRLEARVRQLPGVTGVGLITCPPFGCHWGNFYQAEGAPPRRADDADPVVLFRMTSSGYFATMGIRLKKGRVFEERDGRGEEAERVVIVNETFARTFFPGVDDVVGRGIRTSERQPWTRIIGVVEDVKHYGLERPMRPGVYLPMPSDPVPTLSVTIKTATDPEQVTAALRAAVRELDAELPLFSVRTMEESMRRTLTVRSTYSWMLAVFSLMALVLALGGTYGVSSYLVTQRIREIGIRVALGARGGDIVRGVLRTSLVVVGAGITVGVAASLGVARWLESLLFGVKPHDVAILTGAISVLLAAAIVANVLPARRAARVDPMTSLRAD